MTTRPPRGPADGEAHRPLAERWEWQVRGACRDVDSSLFFHPEHERGSARAARDAQAKQICRGCAVIVECRRHALLMREPYGVWGALSESERADLIRDHDHDRALAPVSDPATTVSDGSGPGGYR